jgi:subfamily B ATP-binding cassette protein HlyB/CyaB
VDGGKALLLRPYEPSPRVLAREQFLEGWEGTLLLLRPEGETSGSGAFGLRWFLPALRRYRRHLAEVLLAALVLQLFSLLTPVFTQVVIDKVLVHRALATLDVLAVGLATIAVFELILGVARTLVFTQTTSKIDAVLGARLFRHLVALPLAYFEARRVGDTAARVRELENIRQFLTGAPLTAVIDCLFVGVFLAAMLVYSPTLTLVTLAILPFYAGLSAFVIPVLRRRLEERFQQGAEVQSYLVEAVTGIHTVKALALEPQAEKRWESLLADYVRASFRTASLASCAGTAGQFLHRSSYLIILWVGARLAMRAEITVGQLIAFQMLSGRMMEPVLRFVRMWQDFQQAGLSMRRLADVFDTPAEPAMNRAKARLPRLRGQVRFDAVTFRYRVGGPEAVRALSFAIEPGTTVGFLGRSGSGKTTISKLIQRLYVPESGRISIDGVDLALADPAWLRRQIGVVLQDSFLFHRTVRDNIAIQAPSAPMEQVVRAAQLAGAHEFILELPEAYETWVGERGASLSGGQCQRISIARALLTDPRILIFDEATSALDSESERIIQANMARICRGRTVVLIAHRLSTLRHADRLIVVDRGTLAEEGTHESLLRARGLYWHFHGQQVCTG